MRPKKTIQLVMTIVMTIHCIANTTSICAQTVYSPEIVQRITRIESSVNGAELLERMQHYKVPGVSIALINNNKIEWVKAYGTINSKTGVPVTTESFFQAASVTKSIVAVIALHYVDRGVLDLDKDVNTYLKSWKIPENEFTKDQKVTLRLLLSHQSGLPTLNLMYEENSKPTLIQVLKGELPALHKPAAINYVPGTSWGYSNIGFVVIQQLLEDITGKPLSQLMKDIIFDPLEMKSSTLVYPLSELQQKNEALPHFANGEVGTPYMHPTALAHGGLMTTPSDLAKFTVELINSFNGKSNKILSKKMVQKMCKKELDIDPSKLEGLKFSQGIGVFLNGEKQNLYFSHTGSNYPGAISILGGLPKLGKGIIIMTNGASGFPLIQELLTAIEKEYKMPNFFEKESRDNISKKGTTSIDEKLKPYIGVYEFSPDNTIAITANGKQLFAEITGRQGRFEIFQMGKDIYNVPGFGIEVTFLIENEIVTGLNFSRGGKANYAKKQI